MGRLKAVQQIASVCACVCLCMHACVCVCVCARKKGISVLDPKEPSGL
jgi:hypothetical protein